ncbi:hypothetical protein I6G56_14765 [Burkholderia humptydooensis]|uniref:Uncharacterized protein n=1 Tax=Burkholderia humptydooensis TaxID=430531 RepID=A0A7T2WXN3_9BURK|nr:MULTISPECIES: hypothetical protein [Burkholderia]AJY44022.1 hypothetical protein BW21_1272 [Burkholderia sp. 2002721687]QPS42838.1 hypothetical protein I6G56_14765 [Burkholderia humptydooensis]
MTLWDDTERQALAATRQMTRSGELLSETAFRRQLRVSARRFACLITNGSVFAIDVDRVQYFPAILAAREIDLRRLHSICRILVPAPPWSRFVYLTSRHANIGGISPVDALRDEKQYRLLRRMASAWAAEWSRTSVSIYAGHHEEVPVDTEPILTAADEVDPRTSLWKRATAALRVGGYRHPSGPYPSVSVFTVFVVRHTAGETTTIPEARIHVTIDHGTARALFVPCNESDYEINEISVASAVSVVDVLLRTITKAAKSQRSA